MMFVLCFMMFLCFNEFWRVFESGSSGGLRLLCGFLADVFVVLCSFEILLVSRFF